MARKDLLLAVNILIVVMIALVVYKMVAGGSPNKAEDSQSEALAQDVSVVEAAPAVQLQAVPLHDEAVVYDQAREMGEEAPYGGQAFQAVAAQHLLKQSATLMEELNAAVDAGRTNDSLALTEEQILELERKGQMIY